MATTTNYGWTTPDDTSLVKDGASAIRTLGSSVDTTVKNLNPETTLGDISYRSSTANTNTRLAIGTSGQVLTVSGGVPTWATQVSGGITLISETTASTLTSLTLGSIPSTYKDLVLVWGGVFTSDSATAFFIRFNNNSGNSYQGIYNEQTTIGSNLNNHAGLMNSGGLVYGSSTSTIDAQNGVGVLTIYDYASSTRFKRYDMESRCRDVGNGVTRTGLINAVFSSTTAISSIDIYRGAGTGSFSNVTSTSIRLYGVS